MGIIPGCSMGYVLGELWPIWPSWFTSSQPGHDALRTLGRLGIVGEMKGNHPEWTVRMTQHRFFGELSKGERASLSFGGFLT